MSTGDRFLARVHNALHGISGASGKTGRADIAGLLRQGMLRCQLEFGKDPELRVPPRRGLADRRTLETVQLQRASCGNRLLRTPATMGALMARSWRS